MFLLRHDHASAVSAKPERTSSQQKQRNDMMVAADWPHAAVMKEVLVYLLSRMNGRNSE